MTHYKNIATQLIAMLESYNFSNNDNNIDVKSDFYIPCVDSSTESIQSILEQINNQVNPSSAGSGEAVSGADDVDFVVSLNVFFSQIFCLST